MMEGCVMSRFKIKMGRKKFKTLWSVNDSAVTCDRNKCAFFVRKIFNSFPDILIFNVLDIRLNLKGCLKSFVPKMHRATFFSPFGLAQ